MLPATVTVSALPIAAGMETLAQAEVWLQDGWRLALLAPDRERPSGESLGVSEIEVPLSVPARRQRGVEMLAQAFRQFLKIAGESAASTGQAWALYVRALAREGDPRYEVHTRHLLVLAHREETRIARTKGIEDAARLPYLVAEYDLVHALGVPDRSLFERAAALARSLQGPGGPRELELWMHRMPVTTELWSAQSRDLMSVLQGAPPSQERHRLARLALTGLNFNKDAVGFYHFTERDDHQWAEAFAWMEAEAQSHPTDLSFREELQATRIRQVDFQKFSHIARGGMPAAGLALPLPSGRAVQGRLEQLHARLTELEAQGAYADAARLLEGLIDKPDGDQGVALAQALRQEFQPWARIMDLWIQARQWDQVDACWQAHYLPAIANRFGDLSGQQVKALPERVEAMGQGVLAEKMRLDFLFRAYSRLPQGVGLGDLSPLSRALEAALWLHAPVHGDESASAALLEALDSAGAQQLRIRLILLADLQRYSEAWDLRQAQPGTPVSQLAALALEWANHTQGQDSVRMLSKAQDLVSKVPIGPGFSETERVVLTALLQEQRALALVSSNQPEGAVDLYRQAFEEMGPRLGVQIETREGRLGFEEMNYLHSNQILGEILLALGRPEECLDMIRTCRKHLEAYHPRSKADPYIIKLQRTRGEWETPRIPWEHPTQAERILKELIWVRNLIKIPI